jgi:hypothetical protein
MPQKQATSYSVAAPGNQRKKNSLTNNNYSESYHNSQPITSIPLDKDCYACGYSRGVVIRRKKVAFAVKCGSCDTFQFLATDEQLEILAAVMPVGGCDE